VAAGLIDHGRTIVGRRRRAGIGNDLGRQAGRIHAEHKIRPIVRTSDFMSIFSRALSVPIIGDGSRLPQSSTTRTPKTPSIASTSPRADQPSARVRDPTRSRPHCPTAPPNPLAVSAVHRDRLRVAAKLDPQSSISLRKACCWLALSPLRPATPPIGIALAVAGVSAGRRRQGNRIQNLIRRV